MSKQTPEFSKQLPHFPSPVGRTDPLHRVFLQTLHKRSVPVTSTKTTDGERNKPPLMASRKRSSLRLPNHLFVSQRHTSCLPPKREGSYTNKRQKGFSRKRGFSDYHLYTAPEEAITILHHTRFVTWPDILRCVRSVHSLPSGTMVPSRLYHELVPLQGRSHLHLKDAWYRWIPPIQCNIVRFLNIFCGTDHAQFTFGHTLKIGGCVCDTKHWSRVCPKAQRRAKRLVFIVVCNPIPTYNYSRSHRLPTTRPTTQDDNVVKRSRVALQSPCVNQGGSAQYHQLRGCKTQKQKTWFHFISVAERRSTTLLYPKASWNLTDPVANNKIFGQACG